MRLVEGRVVLDTAPPEEATAARRFAGVDALVDHLAAVGADHGVVVQALDAGLVAGHDHLESAVAHANRAVARGEAVADDRGVEVLCYAAGVRQIDRALELGVDPGPGVRDVVVVVDEGRVGVPATQAPLGGPGDEAAAAAAVAEALVPASTLGTATADALAERFDVTDAERAATDASLETLVRERVALLDVRK